jgi:hypothetical protein
MDVGCGTGILSIFCAFAGARKASFLKCLLISFLSLPITHWRIQTVWWKCDGNACIRHVILFLIFMLGILAFHLSLFRQGFYVSSVFR